MSMMRWDPFAEMTTLRQAIDQLFENSFIRPGNSSSTGGLGIPVDLVERNDAIVVKASLPGVKPDDLQIQIQQNMLTITGEQHEEREQEQGRYYLAERRVGRMSRSIALPVAVDADASDAVFAYGVLTLTLPKAAQARTKQIAVRPSSQEQLSSGGMSNGVPVQPATADRT
jgi:HSP20 family protein